MYRTICTHMWRDRKIKSLSRDGKLLFCYLLTNSLTHLSGIYYLPPSFMKDETGLSPLVCATQLDYFMSPDMELASFDHATDTIWVTNMFSYQGQGVKQQKAAAAHLETLHHSALIPRFLAYYPRVVPYCADTLSIPSPYPIQSCPSVPVLSSLHSLVAQSSTLKSNGHATEYAREVLTFLNEKGGRHFRPVPETLKFIVARMEGDKDHPPIDVQTCKSLIARKIRDWQAKPELQQYLRPQTLFNKTNFESYLAEVSS